MLKPLSEIARDIEAARALPDDARLDPVAASAFLAALGRPLKPSTLARWRCVRSDGPRFSKTGKTVNYTAGALREFVSRAA